MRNMAGENNPRWKGDNVGYDALHDYIRARKIKPEKCERCNKKRKLELSCNGKYTRNLDDYEYICKSCHGKKDRWGKLFEEGEKHPNSKLKNKDILKIRQLYKTGKYSQQKLAEKFFITQTTISTIIKKVTWKHI